MSDLPNIEVTPREWAAALGLSQRTITYWCLRHCTAGVPMPPPALSARLEASGLQERYWILVPRLALPADWASERTTP